MSISTIRRQVKNVAYNFSDAQVKVREATSNDPWGPSTALMSEIADLTNNPMAFTEIMSIIWKRLNDSGKNWRHVYKSLVLLDFLIKCGNEKVAQQCRENIFTIETLKDFQHIEENRDQGLNIREKAKQITTLLSDEERLTNERTRFMLTRNKFKQANPSYNAAAHGSTSRARADSHIDPELEEARPSTITEEEMQLQIALALSREESEKADEMRKGDEVRLQLALEESRAEAEKMATKTQGTVSSGQLTQSALDDLLSLGVGELVIGDQPQPAASSSNAWGGAPSLNDPWALPQSTPTPSSVHPTASLNNDPWAPTATPMTPPGISAAPVKPEPLADPFAAWEQTLEPTPALTPALANSSASQAAATNGNRKTPENFLGENSNLVNLDNLLGTSTPAAASSANPFMLGSTSAPVNPFTAAQRKSPTLNEMRAAQQAPPLPSSGPRVGGIPQPLQPTQANPFASPF